MTIHDQRLTEFLKRIPHGAPARIATQIGTAFGIVATAREKIAIIRSDAKLTRDGQNTAIAAALAKGPLPHMWQLKSGVDRDLSSIASEREGMRRGVTEASNFPETRKIEVRAWLSRLTDHERLKLAHTTRDPLIIESVATAQHYLSSLTEVQWETLVSRTVEDRNHARLAELATLEESFAQADAAIKVATADMRRESGLGETEFETLAA